MTITGMDAWLTLALDEKDANKAIVLAGSIRRTFTTQKLAVLTTFGLPASARERLQKAFDLVAFVEQTSPNGCSLDDHAKKEAFSLLVFTKVVFLSPSMVVLKNCDDLFDKYENFAMGVNGDEPDSSIYLFTPSLANKEALTTIMHSMTPVDNERGEKGEMFAKCFRLWLDNHLPVWNNLGEEYNVLLDLKGGSRQCLSTKMSIANFGDCHPVDLFPDGDIEELDNLGTLEKFGLELCRKIIMEDLRNHPLIPLPSGEFQTEPIAIVGMSFRLPGGNNVDEFWDLLINGKDAITLPPESRWLPEHIYRPCQTRQVTAGFLSGRLDEFDYKFFGISGKEAEFIDPQYRLLHEVAWEALEDAMIDPNSLRGTQTGIFVGSWLQDYKEIVNRIVDEDFFRAYMGTSIGAGAARLSHFFETVGPNISTESGCSSAIVAVDMACKSLRNRDSNMALACGVNLLLTPFDNNTLKLLTSPEGRCKTFDEGADGFGRAEGCAVLLMKRLSDAVRDGDNIWGMIRGSAVTQEGTSHSLGTPTIQCESLAMELALKDAHVDPLDVSYIEAHGTGTVVGDPLEIAAITKAYYSSGRTELLVIGSVKTNVGHTESVSGITGIIKVLLSMRNGMIPPHINLKKLNPAIDLDRIPAKIPLEPMSWGKVNGRPRIAGVSSFGISGSDGHVIIQEPPMTTQPKIVCNEMKQRPLHIMKLSAKSSESLQEQIATYENMFALMDEKSSDVGFKDFAYSANTGRATFNHRAVILAADFKEAALALKNNTFNSTEIKSSSSPLCFLFTGQGTQYPHMGAELYETSPVFRDEFNKCEQILSALYKLNLQEILWADYTDDQSRARYAQIGIFCIEYCLLRLWESWGVRADYVLGHSLGEFAAAVAAGILSLQDSLIMIVEGRSRSMECLQYGKMIVIPAGKEKVELIIQKFTQLNLTFWADYAALNSPSQTVLAGEPKMIDEFAKFCGGNSIPTTVLGLTHAYHSRLMEPMREPYRKVAQSVKTLRPGKDAPKYISALKGRLIEPEEIDADYWLHHLGQTVNFMDACKTAKNEGCTVFLDIGPHPVLSALTMANFDGEPVTCLPSIRRKQGDWATMLDSLAKLYLSEWRGQVDWKGFDQFYQRSRVPLPFYQWNRKPVWKHLEVTLPSIHPLLGKVTPTGCGHTIFENRITLKNTPFVRDHVVGKMAVFPAAAFMEMCLAGGFITAHGLVKPRGPVGLQSLRIVSPLGLVNEKFYRLQTTSKLEMEEDGLIRYGVGINRNVTLDSGGAGGWISQATAKFLPVPPTQFTPFNVDIQTIQDSWEAVDLSEFYDRLPEIGLRFGSQFRSLEKGWKSETGALITVKRPDCNDDRYLIHPILVDAMIQVIMLWTCRHKLNKMKLHVPLEIGEFLLLERPFSQCQKLYVYCWKNQRGRTTCVLMDEWGTHLARMSDVGFIETNVKLMEGMMQNQGATLTKIWMEVRKSSPLECDNNLEPPQSTNSWLIFDHSSSEKLSEKLKYKLEGVSRLVQIVRRPSTCTEDQIKKLIKSVLIDGSVNCEGIIYLWGLPTCDAKGVNRDQSEVSLPLLSLVQGVMASKCKVPPRIYVVTHGVANLEGQNVTDPTAATLQGMIKSFSNELFELQLTNLDLSPDESLVNQVDEVFQEVWNTDKDNLSIAFRDGDRLVPKMVNARIGNNQPLPLPSGCDRFQLVLPPTKMISDLEFGILGKYSLEENEVEVEVKAVALNFRDVFAVLKPIPQFEEINSVGVDYAGVVSKVGRKVKHLKIGDRVIGMNMEKNLSLPSHIKTDEECVIPLPPSVTFAEGVTLPAVFFTSYLCLVSIAKMKRGDTVLIHTASGGVGLCAIQLAKLMGAEIIVTAGSKRKQNYLRNLGIQHVFHSRTTEFGKQILEVTNGRGVDIVLNSITGEGFKEASLSALGKNGRFIEMSKLNVWDPEEVKELRPDVSYQIVDLTTLHKSEMLGMIDKLKDQLVSSRLQPIPYEQFEAVNIRGALSYLQKAKHIGKIVCLMPEVKVENSKITATTHLFNELSTYLVTGGLGGIGFEVVKWMLNCGAKHIAIVSRNPPNPAMSKLIDSWNKEGKHVEAFPVDIGDYDQCRQLFQELSSPERGFPQLRGVMHAAGVLADALVENQTWDNFKSTYNPKVNGTWNLHDLTKDLLLEHFVLFSSIAASFGSPGQSNHAASNSFEDSLAAYRISIGLPATSINWGNWGEVGVASEVDFPGMRPISTSQGILTLETVLKTQESHLCACNIDSFALAGKIFPSLKTFVEDKRLFGDLKGDLIINTDEFWKEVDETEEREGKLAIFKNLIKTTLRTILKMNPDEVINDLTEFQNLGVDSLMMLEMKNGLQNILGSRLTLNANEVKDCTNTDSLASRLLDNLEGEEYQSKIILPSLQELIQEDSILPEHIQIQPGQELNLCKISEVGTILLTGVTGSLGPYILTELCRWPSVTKIICLIRKSGKLSLPERLTKRLKEINLVDQVDMSKVECIRGDLTEDKLGLSEADYNRLAEQTDAVINSAVRADHTAKYFKAPEGSKQDIRSVNVKSTVRILEFAVHSKLKHVFHASSLLCVFTTDEEEEDGEDCYDLDNDKGYFSEKWQGQDILDHLPYNLGYPLSKHISEELCRQAVERGIPCSVFRLPIIGGDSRNGRCDYRSNHVTLRWLTFLKLKCIPETLTPIMVIPVDQCAQLCLDVFFHSQALPDVYNVIHQEGGSEGEIVIKIADELGIQIDTISMHDFIDKVKQVGDDSPLAPFMKLYRDDEEEFFELLEENSVIKCLRKVAEDNENFFRSRKLEQLLGNYWGQYESTEVVMRRDITYLKGVGLFDKFGIK